MVIGMQFDVGQIFNLLINSILLIDDNLVIYYVNFVV